MKLRDFAILADQNIHADVASFLRTEGFDVATADERGLTSVSDVDLLQSAVSEDRLILTHDRDFGTLAILAREPVVGIIYLRPGHIDPEFTLESLRTLLSEDPDVSSPFILVAYRTELEVRIRIRQL